MGTWLNLTLYSVNSFLCTIQVPSLTWFLVMIWGKATQMAEICYKKNLLSFLPLIDGNVIFIKKIPNFSHPLMIMQISSSMHNRTKEICALRITSTTSYGISLKYLLISNNLLQKLLIRFAYRTHQNKWEMADSSLLCQFVLLGQTSM